MSECVICYEALTNKVFVKCNNEKCAKCVCWSCFVMWKSKCPVCTLSRQVPLKIELDVSIRQRLVDRWKKMGFAISVVFAGTVNLKLLEFLETCSVEIKNDPIEDALSVFENADNLLGINLQLGESAYHLNVYTCNLQGTIVTLDHSESKRRLILVFV